MDIELFLAIFCGLPNPNDKQGYEWYMYLN